MSESTAYWFCWLKYQELKEILADYMKENNCKTVEEAVVRLLKEQE